MHETQKSIAFYGNKLRCVKIPPPSCGLALDMGARSGGCVGISVVQSVFLFHFKPLQSLGLGSVRCTRCAVLHIYFVTQSSIRYSGKALLLDRRLLRKKAVKENHTNKEKTRCYLGIGFMNRGARAQNRLEVFPIKSPE